MDDNEALLALGAGDPPDKARAREWLFDQYYERLLAALVDKFRLDEQYAGTGVGTALFELCENAANVVPTLEGRRGQPWSWLLMRSISRAQDERRKAIRKLQYATTGSFTQDDEDNTFELDALSSGDDTMTSVLDADQAEHLHALLFTFVPSLDDVDRHIFLHDLVSRYELLSADEARELDDEFLSRSAPDEIYTYERLKKRRQRLHLKLRGFLNQRGIS